MQDVVMLFAFMLALYGVLGLQLFKGSLLYRCYEPSAAGEIAAMLPARAVDGSTDFTPLTGAQFPSPIDADGGVCSDGGEPRGRGTCADGAVCLFYGANPADDTSSFDTIARAWMTIFTCVTLEGWVDVMYATMTTEGALASLYFISLVGVGAFYVINLFLAVLWETYCASNEAAAAEDALAQPEPSAEGAGATHASQEALLVIDDGRRVALADGAHGRLMDGYVPSDDRSFRGDGNGGGGRARPAASAVPAYARHAGGRSTPEAGPVRLRLVNGVPTPRSRGCCGCVQGLVDSNTFQRFVIVLILINTGAMMLEHYPMEAQLSETLATTNLVLTLAFLAEMVLKLCADGCVGYLSDPFNRFDGAIVFLSVTDLVVTYYQIEIGVNTSVLRAMRLLRVFKLVRSWTKLRRVIEAMLSAVGQLVDLFILLLLVIFIFALLGMTLFGGKFTPASGFDAPPRTNFDSIQDAMLTVFVVISGENWNDVYASTSAAVGQWCAPYFVLLVIVGNFVVLNLFVAILLGGFSTDGSADEEDEGDAEGTADADAADAADPDAAAAREAADDVALGCLGPSNPLRQAARAILESRLQCEDGEGSDGVSFDNVIVAVIIVSCLAMTLEGCALEPSSQLATWLERLNLYSTLIFTLEMLLKILADGLAFTPRAYLKSGWNRLDGAIVTASLLSLLGDVGAFRTMRLLRVLRPLRLISRFGNLRIVVDLFIKTLPQVFNVSLVLILFIVVFGILGVQLFAGKLAVCASADAATHGSSDRAACEAAGGLWVNPFFGNFDDILASMLLLFEASTFEGWPDVMYAVIDATLPGRPPELNYSRAQGLYMVFWVILGGMFLLNVFVGVIVDEFARIKRSDEGLSMMDEDQESWVDTMKQLLKLKPRRYPPEPTHDRWRALAYRTIRHPVFEPLVLAIILFNTLLMGLDGWHEDEDVVKLLSLGNLVCTILFCVEAAIKIYALSFAEYIREAWNIFDFSVASISILEDATEVVATNLGLNPSLLRALRTVRILRVIRTVKSAKGLRLLLMTLLLSLPALYNIGSIFVILLTLYSILGMKLFGHVAHGDFLDANANFCSFPVAMLTMLRCSTGESWNGIMHDTMAGPDDVFSDYPPEALVPRCSAERGDCGSPFTSIAFHVSFQVVATFVVLNMMIALILEEYGKAVSREGYRISSDDAEIFVERWSRYDPYATGRMHVAHLHGFIRGLPPPLGLDPKRFPMHHVRDTDVSNHISQFVGVDTYLNDETGAPEVTFTEVLNASTKQVYGEVEQSMMRLSAEAKVIQDLRWMTNQAKVEVEGLSKPKNNLVELHSVCVIQRRWLASASQRAKRNAVAKREAIRLRTPGTLVPKAFLGRVQHSTISWKGRLFVFGGRAEGQMLNDFWEFSLHAGYWIDQSHTVPRTMRPRCGHTALLSGAAMMLIVGGHDGHGYLSDVWEVELNGLSWRQVGFTVDAKKQPPPPPLKSPAACGSGAHTPSELAPLGQPSAALEAAATPPKRTRLQEMEFRLREVAATTVQANARGRRARVAAAWRRALVELEHDAASYIQACWRGHAVRQQPSSGRRCSFSPQRISTGISGISPLPTRCHPRSQLATSPGRAGH